MILDFNYTNLFSEHSQIYVQIFYDMWLTVVISCQYNYWNFLEYLIFKNESYLDRSGLEDTLLSMF